MHLIFRTMMATAFLAAAANAQAPEASFADAVGAAKAAMMSDPARALASATAAHGLGTTDRDAATALWLQSEALTRLSRPTEALDRIATARTLMGDEDAKLRADLSLSEARIYGEQEDQAASLVAHQDAYATYEAIGDERGKAFALLGIAQLYKRARRWDRALDYYEQADQTYAGDDTFSLVLNNNKGSVLRELGDLKAAQSAFEANRMVAERLNTPLSIVSAHLKLADIAIDLGDLDAAEAHVAAAARHADAPGAATWRRFDLLVRARLAEARGQDAAAARLLDDIFADGDGAAILAANQRSHELAARVYERRGDLGLALAHAKALAVIDADLNGAAAANSFNLLNAEFEAANRELEIERLNAARLEAEVAAARQRERTRAFVTAAFALAGVGVLLTVLWHLRSAWRTSGQLEEMNRELTDANEAKTRFLANTSHEIRTPLNAILGMTEAMLRDGEAEDAASRRERLGTIQRSGGLLLSIVTDILDVAKMEAGKLEADLAPTDVAGLARDAGAMHAANAERQGLALRAEIEDGLPGFVTDGKLFTQALGNLLDNAIKFTEGGSVTLAVRRTGDGFEAEVRDTGIGIAPGQMDRLFKAFNQAEGGADRRFGGTGLGLSIVRNIAHVLGGEARVASTPGEGSAFTLRIPAETVLLTTPAPAVREPKEAADADEALAGLRVLLAEDNVVNVQVVRALIGGAVGALDVAEDGRSAVTRFEMEPYDVVLMDNQMPGMSGAEATRRIRALATGAHVPIIGVTGDVAPTVRRKLMAAGMDAIVAKPVSRDALVAALRGVAKRGRARAA